MAHDSLSRLAGLTKRRHHNNMPKHCATRSSFRITMTHAKGHDFSDMDRSHVKRATTAPGFSNIRELGEKKTNLPSNIREFWKTFRGNSSRIPPAKTIETQHPLSARPNPHVPQFVEALLLFTGRRREPTSRCPTNRVKQFRTLNKGQSCKKNGSTWTCILHCQASP